MFDIDGTLVDSHGIDGDLFARAIRRELGVLGLRSRDCLCCFSEAVTHSAEFNQTRAPVHSLILERRNSKADPINIMTKNAFRPNTPNTPMDASTEVTWGLLIISAITGTNA